MHQTITCKLKSSEKDFSRQFYLQNCGFAIFVSKIYTWLASQFNLLLKQSLWPGKKQLMIFNCTIFPSNLKNQQHTNKKYMRV